MYKHVKNPLQDTVGFDKQQMLITLVEGLPTLASLGASLFSFSLAVLAQGFHCFKNKTKYHRKQHKIIAFNKGYLALGLRPLILTSN